MINLLPPVAAKELRASRHNNILLRYLVGSIIVLGLVAMVYIGTYIMMRSSAESSMSASSENKQKITRFKDTEAKAKAYTENLKIAKAIFGSELSYTSALHKIANALPPGTVLETLDLNPTVVGQPITLAVAAKTKDSALMIKQTLEDAKIARNITISTLQETSSVPSAATSAYPVQISLNLTLDKSIFTPGEKDA